ncbi:MAG: DUF1731 domain-containing protein [Chitinophagaceae bacterium]|nr:DUF1731 domain-containing protein [Chitinophagaceae bacterium]MCW5929007.1 DUF1731 domain-containing protein [Chitinophagaceae bacterium]
MVTGIYTLLKVKTDKSGLLEQGFTFVYPSIDKALDAVL